MAIICTEVARQETESHYLRPGGARKYVISGTRVKLNAQLAIINTAPQTDTGYDIDGNEVQVFLDHISMKELGGGVWEATVKYESSSDVTDLQFTFGATSAKIYQALEHVIQYDCINGGTSRASGSWFAGVPHFDGVIGVNGDEVEGVDIEVSTVDFTVTKRRFRSTIPQDYFQILIDIMDLRTPINDGTRVVNGSTDEPNTGPGFDAPVLDEPYTDDDLWEPDNPAGLARRANNESLAEVRDDPVQPNGGGSFVFVWKGLRLEFPEGSLRLRGIPIKWVSTNEVEISYNFSYQRPIRLSDRFKIGNSDFIVKEGWAYGWIRYRLTVRNGATTRVPESFNIEQVYPKRNFNVLDL